MPDYILETLKQIGEVTAIMIQYGLKLGLKEQNQPALRLIVAHWLREMQKIVRSLEEIEAADAAKPVDVAKELQPTANRSKYRN